MGELLTARFLSYSFFSLLKTIFVLPYWISYYL